MARWKLNAKHYLRSPGIEWEYKEQDRESGREVRKRFEVPLLLDPDNPQDWTDRSTGETIVCYEGKGQRRDLVFFGPPTPDMEPLDEEAEVITNAERPKWVNAGQAYEQGQINYSESILHKLTETIDLIARTGTVPAATPSAASVSKEDFEVLQAQVAALMAKNAELEANRV